MCHGREKDKGKKTWSSHPHHLTHVSTPCSVNHTAAGSCPGASLIGRNRAHCSKPSWKKDLVCSQKNSQCVAHMGRGGVKTNVIIDRGKWGHSEGCVTIPPKYRYCREWKRPQLMDMLQNINIMGKQYHFKAAMSEYNVAFQLVLQKDILQDLTTSCGTVSHTELGQTADTLEAHHTASYQETWPTSCHGHLATPCICSYCSRVASASRSPCVLFLVSDWTSIQGSELPERKPEKNESSRGTGQDQREIKEQKIFLFPEKYQEYSGNPRSFKKHPIQSKRCFQSLPRGVMTSTGYR